MSLSSFLGLKLRKSSGVRVTAATYRRIKEANAARDAACWKTAAAAYRDALLADRRLRHIWVQLGHALKESGALAEADEAYAEAAALHDNAELMVYRAEIADRRGDMASAVRSWLAALNRGDWLGVAERKLRDLLDLDLSAPVHLLRSLTVREEETHKSSQSSAEFLTASDCDRPRVFEVTDLIAHYRHQRAPTGIQRVQTDILYEILTTDRRLEISLCCFVSGLDFMVAVPVEAFKALIELARSGSNSRDYDWQVARISLLLDLICSPAVMLPPRAILINLGTSLWVPDYFRFIRNAKATQGVAYIPFIHDLIPALMPQFCVPSIRHEFAAWLTGLFYHADGYLVNSRSTAADLTSYAKLLGHEFDRERLIIVRLDAYGIVPFRGGSRSEVAKWGLADTPYVLMVSTIEPRKNHLLAFDVWSRLIRAAALLPMPRLVCVGRNGWLNEEIYARLSMDPGLIAAVTIIHGVSEAELASLYHFSDFTLYPSHYEGWGLPVTESLANGKVPLIADNSSLPEAGAGYAVLCESGSTPAFAAAVQRLSAGSPLRDALERRIVAEYKPRTWAEVAAEILQASGRIAACGTLAERVPTLLPGRFYRMQPNQLSEVSPDHLDGEIFRVGEGWLWPTPEGCRTTKAGATLRLRLHRPPNRVEKHGEPASNPRLYLRVRGLDNGDCPVDADLGTGAVRTTIPAGTTMWIGGFLSAADAGDLLISLRGEVDEEFTLAIGGQNRIFRSSITLIGLIFLTDQVSAADGQILENIERWQSG